MEIIKQLSAVMETVGAVTKDQKNQAQGFNFRGIDAVVNAVSPALRKHSVVVLPTVISSEYTTVVVGRNQTTMGHARVTVQYTFYATDGSSISATVSAESMDSGDKATAKAMSVALRTALLQSLCLPTDEIDPDHDVYERATIPSTPKPPKTETKSTPAKDAPVARVINKAQGIWIGKQITQKHGSDTDPMSVVSTIIGRTVASLDEVTAPEARTLIETLAGGR